MLYCLQLQAGFVCYACDAAYSLYPAKTSMTTSKNALAIFAKYPRYLRITCRLKSAYVTDSWLFEKLKPRSRNRAGKLRGKWQRAKRCCLHLTQLFRTIKDDAISTRNAMLAWYVLWPRICLSQVGVLLKWINIASRKQNRTIAQGIYFSDAKDLREITPVSYTHLTLPTTPYV